MPGSTTDTVTYGPVTYHTRIGVGRLGDGVWLTLCGGQEGVDWEQRAFGVLSATKARELAARLLIEAARIDGTLGDAEVGCPTTFVVETCADYVGASPGDPREAP